MKNKSATYDHAKVLRERIKVERFAKKLCKGLEDKLTTDDIIVLSVKNNFSISILRHFIKQQGDFLDE
jgi:hypothetical protein